MALITQAKRKSHVNMICTLPLDTQQIPIVWMEHIDMIRFCHIKLNHQCALASSHDAVNELVSSSILHSIGESQYYVIDPVP